MCYITATELKKNLGHYLEMGKTEDVYVTKNNKVIIVLTNPNKTKYDEFLSLRGCLSTDEDVDFDEVIGEEIMKRCGF